MRERILLFVFIVLPTLVVADPQDCRRIGVTPDTLTSREWDALSPLSASSDPIILESRFLLFSKPISTQERQRAAPISWETAKRLILLGAVNRIFEAYPGNAVYLATWSGHIYTSKAPGPKDVASVVSLVDPCNVYIHVSMP